MSFFDKLLGRYTEKELSQLLDCWGFGRLEIKNPYEELLKVVQKIVLRGRKVSCTIIATIINHQDLSDDQRVELIKLLFPLCYDKQNLQFLVLSFSPCRKDKVLRTLRDWLSLGTAYNSKPTKD